MLNFQVLELRHEIDYEVKSCMCIFIRKNFHMALQCNVKDMLNRKEKRKSIHSTLKCRHQKSICRNYYAYKLIQFEIQAT